MKVHVKALPKHLWKRGRTGKVVCKCGRRYGSEFDGLCSDCRGMTAWQANKNQGATHDPL
jgi:hypothetical protein